MRERLFNKSIKKTLIIFSATFLFAGVSLAQAQSNTASTKTTVKNGKTFLEHTVTAKDTYYQLSRIYGLQKQKLKKKNPKRKSQKQILQMKVIRELWAIPTVRPFRQKS